MADPRPQMSATPPAQTSGSSPGISRQTLMQALLAPSPLKDAKDPNAHIPQWLWAMPGFGDGVAQRRKLDTETEDLKLRKAQVAGQQATMEVERRATMHNVEVQRWMTRVWRLYRALLRHDSQADRDPQLQRDVEGQIVQGLAEAGESRALQAFLAARQQVHHYQALEHSARTRH
jgi:hypothetical protein